MRFSIAIAILLLGVSGCVSNGSRYVWQPYTGATPSMPLQQAQDVCRSAAQASRSGAQANYDAQNRTYSATPNLFGGYNVSASNNSGGGFWGGVAQGVARGLAGNSAFSRTMTGCMAERGYQRVRVTNTRHSQVSTTRSSSDRPLSAATPSGSAVQVVTTARPTSSLNSTGRVINAAPTTMTRATTKACDIEPDFASKKACVCENYTMGNRLIGWDQRHEGSYGLQWAQDWFHSMRLSLASCRQAIGVDSRQPTMDSQIRSKTFGLHRCPTAEPTCICENYIGQSSYGPVWSAPVSEKAALKEAVYNLGLSPTSCSSANSNEGGGTSPGTVAPASLKRRKPIN